MSESKKPLLSNNFSQRVEKVIDTLKLPEEANKELLKLRFLDEIKFYEQKRNSTRRFYNIFRFIVTTGSILLPAILSIGQMDPNKLPKNFDQITYWSSWTISLMVTISNGFLQLFSLDKNYFNYSLTVEQLKTEGWQFFGLSGKYEDYKKHDMESYKNFCKNIETIKRKQIEQEFNGKADSKKKAFNFAGEMAKLKDEIKQSGEKRIIPQKNVVPPPIPIRDFDLEKGLDLVSSFVDPKSAATDLLQNVAKNTVDTVVSDVKSKVDDVKDNVVNNVVNNVEVIKDKV
tara:strand:+ start:295 stop:1155 length:861 start_codon:yes stop_codon:yes gene_type:complete